MPPARKPIADRFWPKVDRRGPDECWPWLAASTPGGYGVIGSGGLVGHGGDGFMRMATHVSWEIANGTPWPDGKWALHSCDNPPCVNPRHIEPGDQIENMSQAKARRRVRSGTNHPMHLHPYAARGAAHGLTHLTDDDIRVIRAGYASGRGYKSLADEFAVAPATIKRIVTRETWRHVA